MSGYDGLRLATLLYGALLAWLAALELLMRLRGI